MKQYINIIILVIIAVLNCLIWNIIDTPLKNELLELTGEINEIHTNRIEIKKYGLISFFITIVMFLPFFGNKEFKPKFPFPIGILVMTFVFTLSAYFLDQNVKGIYLVGYMGDDFPFIVRIIRYFLLFPVVLYLLTFFLIKKIRKRNIIGFFLIGFISAVLSAREPGILDFLWIKRFRKIISEGHFIFWITFLLGFQFWLIANNEIAKKAIAAIRSIIRTDNN